MIRPYRGLRFQQYGSVAWMVGVWAGGGDEWIIEAIKWDVN